MKKILLTLAGLLASTSTFASNLDSNSAWINNLNERLPGGKYTGQTNSKKPCVVWVDVTSQWYRAAMFVNEKKVTEFELDDSSNYKIVGSWDYDEPVVDLNQLVVGSKNDKLKTQRAIIIKEGKKINAIRTTLIEIESQSNGGASTKNCNVWEYKPYSEQY